jgi:hypothetical protein
VHLAALSGALELASKTAAKELAAIEERADGTASEDYDFEATANDSHALIQLVSRAVAYELVAIVEHRMHELAERPWLQLPKGKRPKLLSEIPSAISLNNKAEVFHAWLTLKEVSEENFQ